MNEKEYSFDAAQARDNLVQAIRELAETQGFNKVVLGISGGKDSTVSAALCARALGKENVYGVMLPDGTQKDISDSIRVCDVLGIWKRTVNIGPIHEALKLATDQYREGNCIAAILQGTEATAATAATETTAAAAEAAATAATETAAAASEAAATAATETAAAASETEFCIPFSRESDINVGPRLRMTTLRYIAQAIGARLVGTGNLSEATVGYCTKDGDTSCDFALLGNLTSVEVVEVGLSMEELPAELVQKTPTDGLSGLSDEEKMGLKYRDIHAYIRFGTCGDPETDEKIRKREAANMHKRRMPQILDPFRAN